MDRLGLLGQALIAAALVAWGALPAHAQLVMGRQATVIQTVTTSAYLNGGIGADRPDRPTASLPPSGSPDRVDS